MHNRGEELLARIGCATAVLALSLAIRSRLIGQDVDAVTDLGTFGGHNSLAGGINDLGQASGQADNVPGGTFPTNHAFLYSNGAMNDLGVLSVYTTGMGTVSRSW